MNASDVAPVAAAPIVIGAQTHRRLGLAIQVGLAVAAVGAAVLGRIWFDSDASIWVLEGHWFVGELIPGVVTCAIAAVWLLRHPAARAVGWTLMTCAVLWGASVLGAGLFLKSFAYGWDVGPPFAASIFLSGLGFLVAFLVLPQVYPTGVLQGRRWRVLLVLCALGALAGQGLQAWWNLASYNPPYDEPYSYDVAAEVQRFSWLAGTAITLASLGVRIRRGPRARRQQVGLFAAIWLVAVALMSAAQYGMGPDSDAFIVLTSIWAPLAVGAVAAAVVGLRLYDVRLVLRRAVIYGVMALTLTVVFAAVYAIILLALPSLVRDERWRWTAVMAAVVVVLCADPLRRRLRAHLERKLLGMRGDPLRSLAKLTGGGSAGRFDESTVFGEIVDTVAESVRAPGVTLTVHRDRALEIVARSGVVSEDPVVVALLHRGERLGQLEIAARTPGEVYSRADRALLGQLANQAAAVVYGLRRDRDIDLLRQEAIGAMAEQRMVLGRDLHDGLAPLLAGAGLTADALRRGMPAGSADADEAARLAARLRNASTEVRRIAHDLQPTVDGQAGLPGLIRDHLASFSGPTSPEFDLEVDDPNERRLPAIVELGLSRVCLEAVNNVVRHARADHVTVSLRIRDELELTIADDGVGIAEPYVSGLGITSMRSRVEALGGTFELGPGPVRGTRVRVTVPLT